MDETDFRSRARGYVTAFAGADVYYASKAFSCTAALRWAADEGLSLDVATGGELAIAQAAGFPGDKILFHGNNKSTAELIAAVEYGVRRIVVDSELEISRIAEDCIRPRNPSAGADPNHCRGRSAHP